MHHPEHVEAHAQLAQALAKLGAAEESTAEYRRTLELDAAHTRAIRELGLLLAQKKGERRGKRRRCWRRAADADPASFELRFELGQTYYRLELLEQAKAALAEALKLAPDSPEAMLALARVHEKLREHAEGRCSWRGRRPPRIRATPARS